MSGIPVGVRPDPIISRRNQWVDQQMSVPAIGSNCVSNFLAMANSTTNGVDVSFNITDVTGMSSLTLVRAAVMDVAQATVLQSWTASISSFTWSDTDAVLQTVGQAYYWLKLEPSGTGGSESIVGPQYILLNPSLLPPIAASGVSASHAAAVNGTVLVTCNVAGIDEADADSVQIQVTGYEGNPSPVAVAQKASTPIQFNLEATGETVTITAITASSGGSLASSGPTCTLTLNSAATAPAKPEGVTVAQMSTGNQVMWPASVEAGVTGYQLWRGNRGDAFGLAALLATITATGEGSVEYLDAAGLSGDFQYFVIAVAGAGNSVNSDAANPQILFSSALIPTNVGANTTNTATIDSIPGTGSATIRIYGPGGVGTSYTRQMGYGPVTRPAGSITGLAYQTRYYILYAGGTYLASTNYSDTLPDGYEWVGVIVSCVVGGSGGATVSTYATSGSQLSQVFPGAVGSGYGTASVTVSGGTYSVPAHVTAQCSAGQVVGYTVTNGGNYSSFVGLSFTVNLATPYTGGGGGTGGARYLTTS